jgi:hypothetical protein
MTIRAIKNPKILERIANPPFMVPTHARGGAIDRGESADARRATSLLLRRSSSRGLGSLLPAAHEVIDSVTELDNRTRRPERVDIPDL